MLDNGPIVYVHRVASWDAAERTTERLLSVIPNAERWRANRIQDRKSRIRFVLSRRLVRDVLGQFLDLDWRRVPIAIDPMGRPVVAISGAPDFNLSHSDEVLAAVFDLERKVGIDVERVRSFPEIDGVFHDIANDREFELYRQIWDVAQRRQVFFRVWTAKEAILKALGVGLLTEAKDVDVADWIGGTSATVQTRCGYDYWWLNEATVGPGFAGAISCSLGTTIVTGPVQRREWCMPQD